uniref:Putative group vi salivary lipocalin n=1 Tax=Rhipicephalus pulchellus TaxID=72859 RepID=L7LTC5_RHIPC
MQLFLYAVLVSVVYAGPRLKGMGAAVINSPWTDEAKFGKYQNALAIINNTNVTYHMASASYKIGPHRKNVTCINFKTTHVDITKHNATAQLKYRINQTEISANVIILALMSKTYSYTYNDLRYQPEVNEPEKNEKITLKGSGQNKYFNYNLDRIIIFSDPGNCVIVSAENRKRVELWVNDRVIDKVPECCRFMFAFFTRGRRTIYEVYNQKCKKPGVTETAYSRSH